MVTILMNLVSPLPNHAAIYMGDQQVLHHVQGGYLAGMSMAVTMGRALPAYLRQNR